MMTKSKFQAISRDYVDDADLTNRLQKLFKACGTQNPPTRPGPLVSLGPAPASVPALSIARREGP